MVKHDVYFMILIAIVGCVLKVKKVGKTQAAQFIYTVAVRRVFKVSKTINLIVMYLSKMLYLFIHTLVNTDLIFFRNGTIVLHFLHFFLLKSDLTEESNVSSINSGNIYML